AVANPELSLSGLKHRMRRWTEEEADYECRFGTFQGLFRQSRPEALSLGQGESMFRNHRSLCAAVLVALVFLLSALPAAAAPAQPAKPARPSAATLWKTWVAQVLAWLGSPGGSQAATSTDTGSQIDPLGSH